MAGGCSFSRRFGISFAKVWRVSTGNNVRLFNWRISRECLLTRFRKKRANRLETSGTTTTGGWGNCACSCQREIPTEMERIRLRSFVEELSMSKHEEFEEL